MELVCIDKQTFEELRVRFCEFEDRVTRLCRPVEDLGLKNWLDNQEVCLLLKVSPRTLRCATYSASTKRPFRRIVPKVSFLSVASKTSFSTNRKIYGDYWN